MPGGSDFAPSVDEIVALIPALRAFARTFRKIPDDIDGLVETTLRFAIANLDEFSPGLGMRTWLLSVMREAAKVPYSPTRARADGDGADPRPSSEAERQISAVIDELATPLREVAMLVGVLSLPYEEAAVICECSVRTVQERVAEVERALSEKATGVSLYEVEE